MTKKPWSDAEKIYLENNFKTEDIKTIMLHLDRTHDSINKQAGRQFLTRETARKNKPAAYKGRKSKSQMPPMTLAVKNAKYKTKHDPCAGKHPVRVDSKTLVYVPDGATKKETAAIVAAYKNLAKKRLNLLNN